MKYSILITIVLVIVLPNINSNFNYWWNDLPGAPAFLRRPSRRWRWKHMQLQIKFFTDIVYWVRHLSIITIGAHNEKFRTKTIFLFKRPIRIVYVPWDMSRNQTNVAPMYSKRIHITMEIIHKSSWVFRLWAMENDWALSSK